MTCQQWLERTILESAIRAGFGDQSLSKLLRALAMNIDGRLAVKAAEEHAQQYEKGTTT